MPSVLTRRDTGQPARRRRLSLALPPSVSLPPVPGVEGLLGAAVLVVGQLPPGFDVQ